MTSPARPHVSWLTGSVKLSSDKKRKRERPCIVDDDAKCSAEFVWSLHVESRIAIARIVRLLLSYNVSRFPTCRERVRRAAAHASTPAAHRSGTAYMRASRGTPQTSEGMCPHSTRRQTKYIVHADQAARQRRAVETVLLCDGPRCPRFLFRTTLSPWSSIARPEKRSDRRKTIAGHSHQSRNQAAHTPSIARLSRGTAISDSSGIAALLGPRGLSHNVSRFPTCRSESAEVRLTRALQLFISIESTSPLRASRASA
jgi:hypothetical protein